MKVVRQQPSPKSSLHTGLSHIHVFLPLLSHSGWTTLTEENFHDERWNNRWNRVSLSRSRMDHHFRGQLFALIWVTTVDILKLNGRYFEHRLRKLEEGKISKRFIIRYAVYFNSFRSFDRSLFRNFERHSSRQTWNKLMMHSDIPRSSHKSFLANKMERWLITRFSDVPIESSFLL